MMRSPNSSRSRAVSIRAKSDKEQPKKQGLLAWIKNNNDGIKILFASIGGLYFLLDLRAKDYLERVKASTEMIDRIEKEDGYKSLLTLDELWLSQPMASMRRSLREGTLSSEEYRKSIVKHLSERHEKDFIMSYRMLKAVSVCVIQGRCEPGTMCIHMAQRIQDFRCNFREAVAEKSVDNGSCIIDEANYFVDNFCQEWMSSYLGIPGYSSIKDNKCLYNKENETSRTGDMCINSIILKNQRGFLSRYLN